MYSLNDHSGIIVRTDSDRWTIVHEFMHHVFDSEARKVRSSDDIREELIGLANVIEKYDDYSSLTPTETRELLVKSARTYNLTKEFLIRFSAEEMSIENILGKKYDEGYFKNVPYLMRVNGAYYISSNAKKISEIVSEINDMILKKLKYRLGRDSETAFTSEIKDLTKEQTNILNFVKEVKIHKEKADRFIRQFESSRNYKEMSGLVSKSAHKGCSHTKAADEVLEILKRVN